MGQNEEKIKTLITKIDAVLENNIKQSNILGAVILIKQGDNELYKHVFVYACLKDFKNQMLLNPEKTSINHLYDIASLTKVIGTTTSIMLLVDRGLLNVEDPISKYIKAFNSPDKKHITIRPLLTHTAGLYEWYPFYYYSKNRQDKYKIIGNLPLKYSVGSSRHYSDLGFMLLGEIIETVSKLPLDVFMEQEIFKPLNMTHTMFNPLKIESNYKIAAT